jgi:alpha/beta superfamily hydrolase
MTPLFPQYDAEILLPGPVGNLEVLTTRPAGNPKGIAIICHPHPLYQGTMRNKVVTMLAKTMQQLEFVTVRFNYRGVGKSEGSYGNLQGEIEDLLAIKAWVQEQLPEFAVWLLGFSFGSFICASVANQAHDVAKLISVAPAVDHADYQQLTAIRCPWLVIQGELDEIVSYQKVRVFALHPPSPLTLVSMPRATHFFHGQLVELRDTIIKHVID